MLNINFEPTHTGRTDVNRTVTRSIDIPGHGDRLKAICKRVQRELLDMGFDKSDMKSPNVLGMDRLQVRAFYAACRLLRHLTPEERLATAIVQTSNDAFAGADKALVRQWELKYG